ncbi:MAG: hypothetical protein FWF40_01350 [Methanomassiliicoccaceae archaeon]|nr:hypothetical protein [Methanomassiliicoccaceae archaeon]
MTVWLCRAGLDGQYEDKFIDQEKVFLIGSVSIDLTGKTDMTELMKLVSTKYPTEPDGSVVTMSSQARAFATKVKAGDLVVLPSGGEDRLLSIGEVTGAYQYDGSKSEFKHSHTVEWKHGTWKRKQFDPDIVRSVDAFDSFMLFFKLRQEKRIREIIGTTEPFAITITRKKREAMAKQAEEDLKAARENKAKRKAEAVDDVQKQLAAERAEEAALRKKQEKVQREAAARLAKAEKDKENALKKEMAAEKAEADALRKKQEKAQKEAAARLAKAEKDKEAALKKELADERAEEKALRAKQEKAQKEAAARLAKADGAKKTEGAPDTAEKDAEVKRALEALKAAEAKAAEEKALREKAQADAAAKAEEVKRALDALKAAEAKAAEVKPAEAEAKAAAAPEAAGTVIKNIYITRCCCGDDDAWDYDILKERRRFRR